MGNARDNDGWAVILPHGLAGPKDGSGPLTFYPVHGNGLRGQHRYPPLGVDAIGLQRIHRLVGYDLRATLDVMGLASWAGVSLHLGRIFDALALLGTQLGWQDDRPVPISWRASLVPLVQTGWLIETENEASAAPAGLTFSPFAAAPDGDTWVHRCGPPVHHLDEELPEATLAWIRGLDHGGQALAVWAAMQRL